MPEKSGAVLTCQVIIKFVIGHGIEEEDRKQSWLKDFNNFTSQVKKKTNKNKTILLLFSETEIYISSFTIDRVHSSVGVQNSHSLETLPADTRNPSGYVLLNLNDNMKRVILWNRFFNVQVLIAPMPLG